MEMNNQIQDAVLAFKTSRAPLPAATGRL
jgi:hypothetical protein